MVKYYEVYSKETGELLAEGTSTECAEQIGIDKRRVSEIARTGRNKTFSIVDVSEEYAGTEKGRAQFIREWNELTAYLRKKWGLEK